jgi:dTDP-4-amino-4,6-dideoxygalactose transaminase
MTWRIPLSDVDLGPEEEAAALRVLRSRWLSMGDETALFEAEMAGFLGVRHAVAVANGTAALHLALLALGIGQGDAVIQPAVNFVAAANMTLAVGAIPIFADGCSLSEPTICPKSVEAILEHNSLPVKAVIAMHYGGYPCRMAELKSLCDKHGLALIEDACHGIGARCLLPGEGSSVNLAEDGMMLGAVGDVGCFSFFSNKNMATGEGGMVTTDRDDLAATIRRLRSHGMTSLTWDRHKGHAYSYDVQRPGFNYRMDELRSAIGREQLKKLPANNGRRREFTRSYWEQLSPLEDRDWTIPFKKMSRIDQHTLSEGIGLTVLTNSSCHLLPIIAPDEEARLRVVEALKQAGIQTSLHYPLITRFSAFAPIPKLAETPNAEAFCTRVITLPLYPSMDGDAVNMVCGELLKSAGNA